jgi:hypothetical protein
VAGLLAASCLLPKYTVSDGLPGGGGGTTAGIDTAIDPGGAGGGGQGGRDAAATGAGGAGIGGAGGSSDAGADVPADAGGGDLAPPRCGDRVCSAGENETNCCKDCGCSGGRYCSAPNCVTGDAIMTWSFDDGCADNRGLQFRLFDTSNNNVWPTDRTAAYHLDSGETDHFQSISCVLAETVCYGAVPDPDDNTYYWGLGLDGTRPRAAGYCGVCGLDNPAYVLQCDP